MLQHDSRQHPSAALAEPWTEPRATTSFQARPQPWHFQGFATDADSPAPAWLQAGWAQRGEGAHS